MIKKTNGIIKNFDAEKKLCELAVPTMNTKKLTGKSNATRR